MRRLCFRLLLGDTVDIAASISDFFGTDTDNLTFWEHGLHLTDCKSVIFVTVLWQDDAAIYDQKIQIRGDRKVTVFLGVLPGTASTVSMPFR